MASPSTPTPSTRLGLHRPPNHADSQAPRKRVLFLSPRAQRWVGPRYSEGACSTSVLQSGLEAVAGPSCVAAHVSSQSDTSESEQDLCFHSRASLSVQSDLSFANVLTQNRTNVKGEFKAASPSVMVLLTGDDLFKTLIVMNFGLMD